MAKSGEAAKVTQQDLSQTMAKAINVMHVKSAFSKGLGHARKLKKALDNDEGSYKKS